MVAHRVQRQVQARRNLLVGQPFADKRQHIPLAAGKVGERGIGQPAGADTFGIGQLLDQGLAEPRCILHDGLDRLDQFQLRALALGDVHQHQQVARGVQQAHGVGLQHAVERVVTFLAQLHIQRLDTPALFQRIEHLRCHRAVGKEVDFGHGSTDQLLGGVAQAVEERFVGIDQLLLVGAAQQGRHRAQAKRLGKALFALAQGVLRLAPGLQVGERKQHAILFVHVQRLPGHDHQLGAAFWQAQLGLHLRDGRAFYQALDRQLLALGVFQHVHFIHRAANDVFPHMPGHFQKALVHLDEAQVAEAADNGGGRVGVEGFFKALLCAGPLGSVGQYQHQRFGLALAVFQHHAAHPVYPAARLLIANRRNLDHDIAEHLPRRHAGNGVLVGFQWMVVAVAQGKTLAITLGVTAQLFQAVDPVHAQGGFVGPDDGLVHFQQHHAIRKPGNYLLQLAAVGFTGKHGVAHGRPPVGSGWCCDWR